MHTKFIALITALALAVTAFSAAPVRADENVRNILAGLAALAVIGAIIKERNDDRDREAVARRADPAPFVQPRPLPPRVARQALPAGCLRDFRGAEGESRLLSLRCIERNFPQLSELPRSCARMVQTARGARWGYGPRCLRRNGYRFAGG